MKHSKTVINTFSEMSRGIPYKLEVTERSVGGVSYDLTIGQDRFYTIQKSDLEIIKRLLRAAEGIENDS